MVDATISRARSAIWHAWAAEAQLRPAEPASAGPALRHVDRFPLPPAARTARRGAPDVPARAASRRPHGINHLVRSRAWPYAPRLKVARDEKPYVLPEGEEQALNARRPAISAWESLHGRELATLTVDFDAGEGTEPHTIDRLLSYVHHPDRETRLSALDTL